MAIGRLRAKTLEEENPDNILYLPDGNKTIVFRKVTIDPTDFMDMRVWFRFENEPGTPLHPSKKGIFCDLDKWKYEIIPALCKFLDVYPEKEINNNRIDKSI